ncbi:MAG TPA: Ig-like domain-containing protein [Chloroflexia bacterium]|nr:Ig-like domain-containing protein [Chloroflexia bacterium]
MSCARYRQLISRYVDGEVTPRQRQELLAHVQACHDCAAWLSRARQTDVLLKGLEPAGPSDRVRSAVLGAVLKKEEAPPAPAAKLPPPRKSIFSAGGLRLGAAGLLLRLDPNPRAIFLAATATFIAMIGLGYYLNVLPPLWGYNKIGFELPGDEVRTTVDVQPLAVYNGNGGLGGSMAVPNPVRMLPAADSSAVATDAALQMRFDQPMDRASVEGALAIDPPLAGTFEWTADNEVSFVPVRPGLLRGVSYTAVLSHSARSLSGTPIEKPLAWSFNTTQPHTVTAPGSGSTLALTSTLGLAFDAPMDTADAGGKVGLYGPSGQALQAALTWDAEGRTLTLAPNAPLPQGDIYLRVGASARTAAGDTLGKAYEFAYKAAQAGPTLRIEGERVRIVETGTAFSVQYSGVATDNEAVVRRANVAVYRLPAERLSELGAQARQWPVQPPEALISSLERAGTFRPVSPEEDAGSGPIVVEGLAAGTYLLRAEASIPSGAASDWQLLVVADHGMTRLDAGHISALWASGEAGRAWGGAEISLYTPDGNLLEKGATSESGLWQPGPNSAGATLAIARDVEGHLAALALDPATWTALPEAPDPSALAASLQTDLPVYLPSQAMNFRVLLRVPSASSAATPSVEQDVIVQLKSPEGAVLSSLTLRPDGVGGVAGSFTLSPQARPGAYRLHVQANGAQHSFPVQVVEPRNGTLSVFIAPAREYTSPVGLAITRTVSVLGDGGRAAHGATITATLGIEGDSWTSEPVSATVDANGRASFSLPLPGWTALYNEPGLYLNVEAALNDNSGSGRQYLDFAPENTPRIELPQLVAPLMDLVAIARPRQDGTVAVRLVQLDGDADAATGDVLVVAQSPGGETNVEVIPLAGLRDATVGLPGSYAGGSLLLARAGTGITRRLRLDAGESSDVTQQDISPARVAPRQQVPLNLSLLDLEGQPMPAVASLWLRKMGVTMPGAARGWEPTLALSAASATSTTLQAPTEPGLWYVMAEAATQDGVYSRASTILRVEPGPAMQLPPPAQMEGGKAQTVAVVLHNPTGSAVNASLNAAADAGLVREGPESQSAYIAPGGWSRLEWRYSAASAGASAIHFKLASGTTGPIAGTVPVRATTGGADTTTHFSGLLSGEQQIEVHVPTGLRQNGVELEIRVSTSLFSALAQVAQELPATPVETAHGVALASARLSSGPAVDAAFRRTQGEGRAGLEHSDLTRSLLLQEIYSAQRTDGGWGASLDLQGPSQVAATGQVLLAIHRLSLASSDAGTSSAGGSVDANVVNRGVAYLAAELARPLDEKGGPAALGERAFGLYVLSVYGLRDVEQARSMMAYAGANSSLKLPHAGQAWLALALWQAGHGSDALVLANRLMQAGPGLDRAALAPMLELTLHAASSLNGGTPGGPALMTRRDAAMYKSAAQSYARALMESRRGLGWDGPAGTADAVWALSLYASQEELALQPGRPTITINDRPVQITQPAADSRAGANAADVDAVSVRLPGNTLHAGTNWLTLKAPAPGKELYYSLTLKVRR